MGVSHRANSQRSRSQGSDAVSGSLNWDERYCGGDIEEYKKRCATAHEQHLSVKSLCCYCLREKAVEIHHTNYKKSGQDEVGVNWFFLCDSCHSLEVAHHPKNWIKDKEDPVWKSANTEEFTERLKLGYRLLYQGVVF
ncbi:MULTISPECIES: hypothetical protein [Nostocales]|uniref:hypothetical protein n=1 Tax=Nostocales TaxID=1161 RepID=UPI0010FAACB0